MIEVQSINLIIDVKEKTDAGTITAVAADVGVTGATGANDTLDVLGETLIDAGSSFTTVAAIGAVVNNTTDGSTGVVESITDNNTLVLRSPGLTGGTDNEWQVSDTYEIVAGYTNGTLVTLNKPFIDISSITTTYNLNGNVEGEFVAIYNFEDVGNPTQFRVLLFDDVGDRASGNISWIARGY